MTLLAAGIRRLEKHAPPVLPLAGQEHLGSVLEQLVTDPDYEWLMIDASHVKVHPHAAGAKGGNQDIGVTKGGLTVRYIVSDHLKAYSSIC